MNRNGFTLIEVLVVVAIVAILAALVIPAVFGVSSYSHEEVFIAKCVRKYEWDRGGDSSMVYRIDLQRPNQEFIETIENFDYYPKRNSATLQANIVEGEWYEFSVRGKRNENWSMFPNVITARKVPDPTK